MTGQSPGTRPFGRHMLHEVAMRDLISSTYRATALDVPAQAVGVRAISSALAATQGEIDGFLRTNSHVSTMDHPHVLRVVDVGQYRQHAYVATVWRDGGPLADLLAARRQLPVWMVVRMAGELAEALDALHGNGIVHGTVGPHSVWIKSRRRGQRASNAALTSFGTSHLLGAALHNAGNADAAGDLLFVAPEQVRDGRSGPASDQYALGCLLFMALTGAPPFTAATNNGLFTQHMRAAPPTLTSLRPELDGAWDAVVGRALDKDPAARYDNCRMLLREVSQCAPPPDDARQTIPAWTVPRTPAADAWPDLPADDLDRGSQPPNGDAVRGLDARSGDAALPPQADMSSDLSLRCSRSDDGGWLPRSTSADAGTPAGGARVDAGAHAVAAEPVVPAEPADAGAHAVAAEAVVPAEPADAGAHAVAAEPVVGEEAARPGRRGLRPVLIAALVAVALVVLVLGGAPSPVDTDAIDWPTWLARNN